MGASDRRKNLIRFVVGSGLANALGMVWSAVAGRTLGPEAGADYFAALFLLQAVYMAGHPLNGVMAKLGAEHRAAGHAGEVGRLASWLLRRAGAVLFVGLVLALITLPWQVEALHFSDPWALALGWIGGTLVLGLGVLRGSLRGALLLDGLAWNFLLDAALRLGVGLALLIGVELVASAAVAAHLVSSLAAAFAATWVLRSRLRHEPLAPEPTSSASVMALALPMLGLSLCDAVWQNADALIAKHALDATLAGHYGAVATLTKLFGVLVQPFALLVIPLLVEAREGPAAGRRLAQLLLAFLGLATVALAVLAAAPGLWMRWLFGAAFEAAAPLVLPQAVGALLIYLSMLFTQALAARGRFAFLMPFALLFLGLLAATVGVDDAVTLAWRQAAAKALVLVALVVSWRVSGRGDRPAAVG